MSIRGEQIADEIELAISRNKLIHAQAKDLHRQLTEAWRALAFWSGRDYTEALDIWRYATQDLEADKRLEER